MSNSNIEIDESKLEAAPSFIQRLKNAALGAIFGATFVQMYFFYIAVKSGSFVPSSIVVYYDSFYFLGYLAVCSGLGWIAGQDFLDWLKVKLDFWKFW